MTGRGPAILYVATEDWFFRSHFLAMARAAMAAGFRVALAAQLGDAAPSIEAQDIRLIPLELQRGTLNPAHVLGECAQMVRLLRHERPDILHLIALKPIVVGGLADLAAPAPAVINSITGLGFLGIGGGGKVALARALLWPLISRLLGRANSWILSDNADDARILGRRSRHPSPRSAAPASIPIISPHFRCPTRPP